MFAAISQRLSENKNSSIEDVAALQGRGFLRGSVSITVS
jgi:hypothetical protein